jgi:hypothetical protein
MKDDDIRFGWHFACVFWGRVNPKQKRPVTSNGSALMEHKERMKRNERQKIGKTASEGDGGEDGGGERDSGGLHHGDRSRGRWRSLQG